MNNSAPDSASLQFLGAAGTVTGSKHLVTYNDKRVLLDCGLFQGLKELRLRNWQPLEVPPAAIDAVVLSHAHIDHSGYLPLLARQGFKGPVYCTSATADLLRVLLLDSAELQEEEADRALQEGAKEIKILGEMVPVNAKIETLDGLSAHADQGEILEWLSGFTKAPRQTYLVHGEGPKMQSLAEVIRQRLGWEVRPAVDGEIVSLQ